MLPEDLRAAQGRPKAGTAFLRAAAPRRRFISLAAALASSALPVTGLARPGSGSPAAADVAAAPLRGTPVLSGLDARPVDLGQYLGRPLLLNVWTTWCAPCVAEMPSLQALRDAHGPAGSGWLNVLALNAGQSINQVEAFLKSLPLTLPIVMDPQKVALSRWKVRILPSTLLFDADGHVRATYVGERDWTGAAALDEIRAALQPLPASRVNP